MEMAFFQFFSFLHCYLKQYEPNICFEKKKNKQENDSKIDGANMIKGRTPLKT